jgi:hypothetical protein
MNSIVKLRIQPSTKKSSDAFSRRVSTFAIDVAAAELLAKIPMEGFEPPHCLSYFVVIVLSPTDFQMPSGRRPCTLFRTRLRFPGHITRSILAKSGDQNVAQRNRTRVVENHAVKARNTSHLIRDPRGTPFPDE